MGGTTHRSIKEAAFQAQQASAVAFTCRWSVPQHPPNTRSSGSSIFSCEAQITKSGFFYHFKDKNELARALLLHYIEEEDQIFDDLFDRARELHEDPLHSFLIGLKMLAEMMADLPSGHPGCLVATLCYTERMYDRSVRELNRSVMLGWRKRFLALLTEIAERYPPRDAVDLQTLADMVSNTVDGGIVLSKALQQPKLLAEQILMFRSYVRLLFLPETHGERRDRPGPTSAAAINPTGAADQA